MSSINIPDSLPDILKNYVKAAIRSQPKDIISWSAEYFKTNDGQSDSIGKYENISTYKQDRTMFRILAFQLGTTIGTKLRIEEVWSDLSLDFNLLEQIYKIGKFHENHIDMVNFLGVTFGHWTKSLKETILLCCEAFCKCLATDGYFLHVDIACKLYQFLAKLDCSSPTTMDNDHSQTTDEVQDNNNHEINTDNFGKTKMMKTSKSLDTYTIHPSSIFGDNKLKTNNICISLESIFIPPSATINGYMMESSDMEQTRKYHVPGIGPSVPEAQIQKVFEYFEKCAVSHGGYVYDFDIENDKCPQLDAVNN